ncbi:hypothetical protein [Hirschia maritima]|uniref:hypothetical protein n=1 Tax=Hirschia maritima TaxID=1121961 RepID=UPI000365C187|nr:hypothetical protein [Hirschia maritima]
MTTFDENGILGFSNNLHDCEITSLSIKKELVEIGIVHEKDGELMIKLSGVVRASFRGDAIYSVVDQLVLSQVKPENFESMVSSFEETEGSPLILNVNSIKEKWVTEKYMWLTCASHVGIVFDIVFKNIQLHSAEKF